MDPVLVQLGPLTIRWYGVLLAATIGLSIVVAYRLGPRLGVPAAVVDRTAVTCAVVALVGARIGYVVSHPGQFSTLLDVLRVDQGGLSSHGALAAGLLYVAWAARRAGIAVWAFADAFVWAIPIGNVLVRIGNFINGELYGDPTSLPWGVRFATAPDAPRHPLQLYEAALAVAILLYARRVAAHRRFEGQVFWTIIVATSLGRLAFDALRSDARVLGPLALGQVPALILVAWGAWALWGGARRAPHAP
jgi:phosphatidylglycerol:prolipoprotein diacylglycerol transferase